MNSPILAYNIRFNLRKKLWFSAIVLLALPLLCRSMPE